MKPNCYPHDALREFALGMLDDDASQQVLDHLQSCRPCEDTVAHFDQESDTLIQGLKQPVEKQPFARNEAYVQALANVVHSPRPRAALSQSGDELENMAHLPTLGEYRLIEPLGYGGMGAVYKAIHERLNRYVAIKLLPHRRMQDEHAVARFRREMLAIGQMNHPSIVQATDAGEFDQTQYLAMELVEGVDVSNLAHQFGPLSIGDACQIARQAADALAYAHEQGVVHRDVKPSNLMLTTGGQVKVLDLGLALLGAAHGSVDDLTTIGQLMGTLDYMPPEQCDNSHEVDERADIYSLGATLYRLLCGCVPYAGEKWRTPLQKLKALATEDAPTAHQLRPEIPVELSDVIRRALARDTNDRFDSMEQFAQAILPWCAEHNLQQLAQSALQKQRAAPTSPEARTKELASALATSGLSQLIPDAHPDTPETPGVSQAKGDVAAGPWRRMLAIAATLAGLLAVGLLGVMLFLETQKGTLKVVSDVPGIEVKVTRGDKVVRQLRIDQKSASTRIAAGRYQVEIIGTSDNLRVEDGAISLFRGETEVARIVHTSSGRLPDTGPRPADAVGQRPTIDTHPMPRTTQPIGILSNLESNRPSAAAAEVPDPTRPLRPGDRFRIEYHGGTFEDLERVVMILADGTARVPYVGSVKLAGKSLDETEQFLRMQMLRNKVGSLSGVKFNSKLFMLSPVTEQYPGSDSSETLSSTRTGPHYQGKSAEAWMQILENDRSPASAVDAIHALQALVSPDTESEIAAALVRSLRIHDTDLQLNDVLPGRYKLSKAYGQLLHEVLNEFSASAFEQAVVDELNGVHTADRKHLLSSLSWCIATRGQPLPARVQAAIVELTGHDNDQTRLPAAAALKHITDETLRSEANRQRLLELAQDRQLEIAFHAATALQRVAPYHPQVFQTLRRVLVEGEPKLVGRAAELISGFKQRGKQLVPELIEVIERDDPDLGAPTIASSLAIHGGIAMLISPRDVAILALGRIGPEASDALEVLERELQTRHQQAEKAKQANGRFPLQTMWGPTIPNWTTLPQEAINKIKGQQGGQQ